LDELTNGEADELIAKKMRMDEGAAVPPPPPPPPPAEPVEEPMDTEEPSLTPNEDASESFTHEAIASVDDAAVNDGQADAGAEDGFQFKGAASPRPVNGIKHSDVMQTATPPTTGSPDEEEAEKAAKRAEFVGMNPDRMRQLGLFDGASE
jgi:histone-lysine N-methyltransferase SETD2